MNAEQTMLVSLLSLLFLSSFALFISICFQFISIWYRSEYIALSAEKCFSERVISQGMYFNAVETGSIFSLIGLIGLFGFLMLKAISPWGSPDYSPADSIVYVVAGCSAILSLWRPITLALKQQSTLVFFL